MLPSQNYTNIRPPCTKSFPYGLCRYRKQVRYIPCRFCYSDGPMTQPDVAILSWGSDAWSTGSVPVPILMQCMKRIHIVWHVWSLHVSICMYGVTVLGNPMSCISDLQYKQDIGHDGVTVLEKLMPRIGDLVIR